MVILQEVTKKGLILDLLLQLLTNLVEQHILPMHHLLTHKPLQVNMANLHIHRLLQPNMVKVNLLSKAMALHNPNMGNNNISSNLLMAPHQLLNPLTDHQLLKHHMVPAPLLTSNQGSHHMAVQLLSNHLTEEFNIKTHTAEEHHHNHNNTLNPQIMEETQPMEHLLSKTVEIYQHHSMVTFKPLIMQSILEVFMETPLAKTLLKAVILHLHQGHILALLHKAGMVDNRNGNESRMILVGRSQEILTNGFFPGWDLLRA